jgi:hypothetical protein
MNNDWHKAPLAAFVISLFFAYMITLLETRQSSALTDQAMQPSTSVSDVLDS